MSISNPVLQSIRATLKSSILERDSLIDGMIVALIAKEPLFVLGPPGCLAGDTVLVYNRGIRNSGRPITLKEFYDKFNGLTKDWDTSLETRLHSLHPEGYVFYNQVVSVWESGIKALLKIEFSDGSTLRLTKDHPVATPTGEFVEAESLAVGDSVLTKGSMKPVFTGGRNLKLRPPRIIINTKYHPHGGIHLIDGYTYKRVARARLVVEAELNGLSYESFISILKTDEKKALTLKYLDPTVDVHHADEDTLNDSIFNLRALDAKEHARLHGANENFNVEYTKEVTVISIVPSGEEMTYDIQMASPANNFAANGIFVHNTAKSQICHSLCNAIQGNFFTLLMSKFTQPEELFGPWSLKGLQEDRYKRITTGKLPESHIAFLDEGFKASSAISNTMLTAINERYINNDGIQKIPLQTLYLASNEIPTSEELGAFYDRFVLRYTVEALKDADNFRAMFESDAPISVPLLPIADLMQIQVDASQIPVSPSASSKVVELRQAVMERGIFVSDRKWKQSKNVVRAWAYLNDHTVVEAEDLTILENVLWSSPDQIAEIRSLVRKICNPVAEVVQRHVDAANEVVIDYKKKKTPPMEAFNKLQESKAALEEVYAQSQRPFVLEAAEKIGKMCEGMADTLFKSRKGPATPPAQIAAPVTQTKI